MLDADADVFSFVSPWILVMNFFRLTSIALRLRNTTVILFVSYVQHVQEWLVQMRRRGMCAHHQ